MSNRTHEPHPLPSFTYHPDPLATGSVIPSEEECLCCGEHRGYVYVGPVFSETELDEQLCPWCIASGLAHDKFAASFVDEGGIGGHGDWETVARPIVEEVAFRTPSFSGWQQERWFTCCGDACMFVGSAGAAELQGPWASAAEEIRRDCRMEGPDWERYRAALDREHGPTAYVFQCRHCHRYAGYSDSL
jgi:uncharacterized protein CbrC (UPF0167 family)